MTTPSGRCPACGEPVAGGARQCPSCGVTWSPGPGPEERKQDLDRVRAALAGRYDVQREVGRGGMATVYLARDAKHQRQVAIKVLQPEIAAVLGSARFLREIEITANLQHPNILPVYDSGEASGILFYVMPYVEGESLRDRLRRDGRVLLSETLQLMREVAGALSYAHSRHVIHRDIKPENILLSQGHAQVADFGIARAISAAGDRSLTRTGVVVGTPAYMAPEQAAGLPDVDGRADLYALAAVAAEMLTGRVTNTAADRDTVERALTGSRPDVSPMLARALTAPLALDRARRPADADEWLRMLNRSERSRPRLSTLTAVGIAAVFLVVFFGWLVLVRDGGAPAATDQRVVAVLPFSVADPGDRMDLDRTLPRAFEDQLQWLPEYRVIGPERVRDAIDAEFGSAPPGIDSLARFVATTFGASEVLWGRAEVAADDLVSLEIQVRDPATQVVLGRSTPSGPIDSLFALVSTAVSDAFASRVASREFGWNAAMPQGLDAFNAFYRGKVHFRNGAYDEAIAQFEEVIRRDSTFAPAYFARMLAEVTRLQPTRATAELRAPLDAARRYRDRLDPTTRDLLAAYETLVGEGRLEEGIEQLQEIVRLHPDAVDAWFLLGSVQVNFAPLLGAPPTAARYALERAHALDPGFAAALAQLARIAILEDDREAWQRYAQRYLAIDSTSSTADLLRMVDSLVNRGTRAALQVTRSIPDRPALVLEMIALTAGDPQRSRSDRDVADLAIGALWDRATSRTDRAIAFRLRMATLLGSGRTAAADTLLREARRRGAAQGEVDRWLVLGEVTGIPTPGDAAARAAAAERLLHNEEGDVEALWLAARWYRGRDARTAADARRRLVALVEGAPDPRPLASSLAQDLEALDLLAAGDTSGARATWREACQRYSIEDVMFGLVGSLWPLRLERARLAAAGDPDAVLAATVGFEHMVGLVDQVAWQSVWPLRIRAFRQSGDPLAARELEERLVYILSDATGPPAALRDSLRRELEPERP